MLSLLVSTSVTLMRSAVWLMLVVFSEKREYDGIHTTGVCQTLSSGVIHRMYYSNNLGLGLI